MRALVELQMMSTGRVLVKVSDLDRRDRLYSTAEKNEYITERNDYTQELLREEYRSIVDYLKRGNHLHRPPDYRQLELF